MKLFIIYILTICLISCQQKDINKIQDIKGHTFLKITEIKSKKVLYKPCYASIETYKFYKDSIYHNWGQEHYNFKGVYTINNDGSYLFKGFNKNFSKKKYTLKIKKVEGADFFWSINDNLFIDSLHIKQILFEKEICKEDINKPIKNNHQIANINNTVILKKASFSNAKIHLVLSNKKKITFKTIYFLEDETPTISVKNNKIVLSYGDDYGNFVESIWQYQLKDNSIYLEKIQGVFPLKNKEKDNLKTCTLYDLKIDIKKINTEKVYEHLLNSNDCTYKTM